MKKLLCVIMSAIILSTTVFAVSAADVSNSVSATPDEAQEQTTEGYCDGFYYKVLDDGTVAVTSCNIDKEEIVIPDTIKGLTVTQIHGFAWRFGNDFEFEKLTTLCIGKNINYIDSQSFYYTCKKLQSITVDSENKNYCSVDGILFNKEKTVIINYPCNKVESTFNVPNTVTEISNFCFAFNQNLTDIIIPNSVSQYGWYSFYTCNKLKSVTLGNGITSISGGFSYCKQLESIFFGNNLQYIDLSTFGSTAIKNFYLPESVSVIDGFNETPYSLENVFIDNEKYFDVNGVLYSREEQKMLLYPASNHSETLLIPEGITALSSISNKHLREIHLPSTVTNIDVNSIYSGTNKFIDLSNCSELQSITVDENNQTFSDINGVLYTKDQTEMLIYPPNHPVENLSLPENTTKTCEISNNNIKTLVIPSTLTELGTISCENLENIFVSADNQTYCSIDGVLYNKSITEMLCFPLSNKITDYHIPDSVAELKGYFENTKHLKNIYVPQSVTEFGHYGFTIHGDCIENIFADDENLNYYSENGVLYYKNKQVAAYPQNNKTKDFYIPEGSDYIYSWFFLKDCKYVENVYIPASLNHFIYAPMNYCESLKNVFVDKNNEQLCDIDGVLYSKDKTKLLLYPRGRNPSSISFPETVTEINGCAFYMCNDLEKVVLPEKMIKVNGSEFIQCKNLRDITFPKGVKQIYGIGYQIGGGPGQGGWIIGDIDNVVIRGYTNSPAETYAKKNGFTFISLGTINKLGDSNSDGVVNIIDATTIQRYLAEYEVNFSENEEIASDTNGDGHITISDVTEIQRFIAELPSAMSES